jgi:sugar (pentulose or hexulose) kinase
VSDFTSIGCHTGLWHYAKKDYHDWVYGEDIDRNLAPIVPTDGSNNARYGHKTVRIGVGIHDSSAALLPYLKMEKAPFLLISTGTWSISLNPFSEEVLTEDDLQNDCLNYMRIDGRPVKAARLFLGNEYKLQVKKLCTHFGLAYGYHRNMKFDESLYLEQKEQLSPKFRFDSLLLHRQQPEFSRLADFQNFESAFHRLMIELMDVQADFARRAIGQSGIEKIYIDGGFADNDIFVKLISRKLSEYKLRTTQAPLGSAVGAALVISGMNVKPGFLKKQYAMRKIEEVLE